MHNITESGEIRDIRVTSYMDTSPVVSEDEDTAGGGTGSSSEDSADDTTDDAEDHSEDADDTSRKTEDAADDSEDADDSADDTSRKTDDEADDQGDTPADTSEVGGEVVRGARQFAGVAAGNDGHPIWL